MSGLQLIWYITFLKGFYRRYIPFCRVNPFLYDQIHKRTEKLMVGLHACNKEIFCLECNCEISKHLISYSSALVLKKDL